ncbi:MAG: pro-sigmaK processing inhibitor BofA family protein [Nanoarchaeota archaeon]
MITGIIFWIVFAVIAVGLVWLFFKLTKKIFVLALNSLIGVFALFGFNQLLDANVHINFWSVIITAIGGIFGFAAVLILHYAGWFF